MRLPPVPKPLQRLNHPWLNVIGNGWMLVSLAVVAYGAARQAGIFGSADVLSVVLIIVGLVSLAASVVRILHESEEARSDISPDRKLMPSLIPDANEKGDIKGSHRTVLADQLAAQLGRGEDLLSRIDRASEDFLSQQAGNPLVQEAVDWIQFIEAKLGDEAPEFATKFKRTPPPLGSIRRSDITLNQARLSLDPRVQVLAEFIRELRKS